jgi:hypothetical protein
MVALFLPTLVPDESDDPGAAARSSRAIASVRLRRAASDRASSVLTSNGCSVGWRSSVEPG